MHLTCGILRHLRQAFREAWLRVFSTPKPIPRLGTPSTPSLCGCRVPFKGMRVHLAADAAPLERGAVIAPRKGKINPIAAAGRASWLPAGSCKSKLRKGHVMQPLLTLKPSRCNYLLSQTVFVLFIMTLTSLVSIFIDRDTLRGFSGMTGSISGFLLGGLLLWAYDERKRFERLTVTLTENALIIPGAWFKKNVYLLNGLDKQRTITYNSENNLRNRVRYTFWLVTGERVMIGKSFYGTVQVNALLEKMGLPKS